MWRCLRCWVPLWACQLVGARRAVQVENALEAYQAAEQHCCCKDGLCPSDAEDFEAVYSPNADLCCKFQPRYCGHILQAFSHFKERAPEKGYCTAGAPEATFVTPEPLQQATIPPTAELKPGHVAHTVHTYCDHEQDSEAADGEASRSGDSPARRHLLQTMVNEVSQNSIDTMAKEIFSIYVCTRWAPTEEFTRIVEGEIAAGQLPSKEPSKLYGSRRFLPLRCSANFKVFEEVGLGETSFRQFEAQMEALATWYAAEAKGAVAQRLAKLEGADSMDEASAFDVAHVAKSVAACGDAGEAESAWNISVARAPQEELLKHCRAARWWLARLQSWQKAMPFTSFLSPDLDAAKFAPKGQEQILMCFGKRVASKLHRREGGSHLLTDQNAIGCHGFWGLKAAGQMLDRIVRLWRPPTCQLASMELAMKLKIVELIANMNERLFDALPALLTEELAPDDDWDGKELRASSLGSSLLHGMWGSIAKSFSALSGQYTRLGQLLGSSVVKWVVCPLRKTTAPEAADLDAALGTEDDTARYYAQIAYSKWTGKENLLPGEECGSGSEALPRTQACSLGILQQDMPEPYPGAQFMCPVRPLLPAKQQLEVLKKKARCPLRLSPKQMEAAQWFFRGRRPQRQQYDLMENLPQKDYQAVQILEFTSRQDRTFRVWRTFVTVGLGCTEEEAAETPRWCADPEVHVPQASLNGVVDAVGRAGRGTAQMVAQALHQAGVTEEAPVVNQAVRQRLSEWLSHKGKGLEAWVKETSNEWFGKASQRYERKRARAFAVQEAAELVHSLSFQKLLDPTGADSKNKQRYDRYAAVVPCKTMDAEDEFELAYETGEDALQLARKAFRKYGQEIGGAPGFMVELMGVALLKMAGVQSAWVESHSLVRAAQLGSDMGPWLATRSPLLQGLAGTLATRTGEGVRTSDLTGFAVAFTCGSRTAMHDLPLEIPASAPQLPSVFSDCVTAGREQNARLRKERPDAPYLREEVVVRATLSSLASCFLEADASKVANRNETQNPVYRTFSSLSGCEALQEGTRSQLPESLLQETRSSQFRGLLFGKGLPGKVLYEVLLDPADFAEEVGL